MAKANHYVNNKDLLSAIIQYKKDCRVAKREGRSKPRIPEYVGKCLLLISENLSHKPNFAMYTFVEEMKSDGIENSIQYFDNFDPKKSKNPFAYFTQIIYYAFLRRIAREKKQLYAKYKMTEQHGILGDMETAEHNDDSDQPQFELYDNISEFIGTFEDTKKRKKKEKKTKLELFMVDEDVPEVDN